MQVKDYLQALTDEGKIRVEKIGSGNWYWSFLSEEKQCKEKTLEGLRKEKDKVDAAVAELKAKTEEASVARDEGDEAWDRHDRASLMRSHASLQEEVETLRAELGLYRDNDPMEVFQKREETTALWMSAEKWTDNIYMLEQYYLELTGNDRQGLEHLRQTLYGEEYREGEGLAEL